VQVPREGLEARAHRREVEAVVERGALDVRKILDRRRHIRQTVGQLELFRRDVHAERFDQFLARQDLGEPRSIELERSLRVKAALARLIERVPVAGLTHAPRELRSGLGRLFDLAPIVCGFAGGERHEVGCAGARRHLHDLGGTACLDRGEALLFDAVNIGRGEQREYAQSHRLLDVVQPLSARAAHREARIRGPAGLNHIGFRNAKLGERGLERAVIEERDPNGVVRRQRPGEHLLGIVLRRGLIFLRALPQSFLSDARLGGARHGVEAPVLRKMGARGEQQCARQRAVRRDSPRPRNSNVHGPSSCNRKTGRARLVLRARRLQRQAGRRGGRSSRSRVRTGE